MALWFLSASINPSAPFTTGSPQGFWREFVSLLYSGELFAHTLVTTIEAILGFLIGTVEHGLLHKELRDDFLKYLKNLATKYKS